MMMMMMLTPRRNIYHYLPKPVGKVKSHKVVLGAPQSKIRRQRIDFCKKRVRELLYEPDHPRGSFTDAKFRQAKYILNVFIRRRGIHPEATLYALWLIDRVFTELALKDNPEQYTGMFCRMEYTHALFEMWGLAAKHSDTPPPPEAAYELMVSMALRCPEFKYDLHCIEIILRTAVDRGQVRTAKMLLERMKKEAKRSPELTPTPEMEKMVSKATPKPWPPPQKEKEPTEEEYDDMPLFTKEEFLREVERQVGK
jgi:hypothetical protein